MYFRCIIKFLVFYKNYWIYIKLNVLNVKF